MFGNRKRIKTLELKVDILERVVENIAKEIDKRKPKRDSKGRFVSKKK